MHGANLYALLATGLMGHALSARADSAATPGQLRSYATIQCLGVEWDITGDANHNAKCRVQYRAAGDAKWREGLPLFRVDYHGYYNNVQADRRYNMFAGSLFWLKPGTSYEVRLALTDPDGGDTVREIRIATRAEPTLPRGGCTLYVEPGNGRGDGAKASPFRGFQAAQAAARPGDVILVRPGEYPAFTFQRGGRPGAYLAWKAEPGAIVPWLRAAASHLWIEGFQLQRKQESVGLNADGHVTDVVVRGNTFDGFHYSVNLKSSCSDWYIADNVIRGDNDPISGGISGEGVELNHSSGHVVCYNRISRTADAVSYAQRNCDIFGNDVFDVSDDGLEPDYGYANVRMWGNRITNCKNAALSFQPMYCGPWYFIRNQITASCEQFKFRVQDRFLMAHNTFVGPAPICSRAQHFLTAMTRNNLFIAAGQRRKDSPLWAAFDCREPLYCLPNRYNIDWTTDVDYDGFDWGDSAYPFAWFNNRKRYGTLEDFAREVGVERHGRRVRKEDIFERFSFPDPPGAPSPQTLALRPGCAAVDAGVVLPGINDDFVGRAPDLGAHELGAPPAHYGPRPSRPASQDARARP